MTDDRPTNQPTDWPANRPKEVSLLKFQFLNQFIFTLEECGPCMYVCMCICMYAVYFKGICPKKAKCLQLPMKPYQAGREVDGMERVVGFSFQPAFLKEKIIQKCMDIICSLRPMMRSCTFIYLLHKHLCINYIYCSDFRLSLARYLCRPPRIEGIYIHTYASQLEKSRQPGNLLPS